MKLVTHLLRGALAAALVSAAVAQADTLYTVTDLGSLGGAGSQAFAINERGQITGAGDLPLPNPTNAGDHAFLYDHGAMIDLGTLWRNSYGQAINNRGQVAGFSEALLAGFAVYRAFLYSGGVFQDIGTLGGYGAQAYGINQKGQVTGFSNLLQFDGMHAFLYSDGVMHDLGTLPGGTLSAGQGINNAGQVAGWSDAEGGRAFLYSDGVMTSLGTLGGLFSFAYAINERGQVTGGASADPTTDNPFGVTHPFIYTDGVMHDIGNGQVYIGWGYAINERGDVVGVANSGPTAEFHGFVYSQGVIADLNALLEVTPGVRWVILEARGINDRGEIVGTATTVEDPTLAHAVLLTPRP
jgi:probable HAF family extracellular repeat protein